VNFEGIILPNSEGLTDMKDHFPLICAMRGGGWSVSITLEILQSQGEFITVDSTSFIWFNFHSTMLLESPLPHPVTSLPERCFY
jgi:hypothetical protein